MKKLPIGIQSFEKIITDNYIYVDKTKYLYDLIENGQYYFLSRPRRFGKSLTIDTLKCLFEGKKHLFEGLFIYDKWDWNKTFPVIHFNLSLIDSSDKNKFTSTFNLILKNLFEYHNLTSHYNPNATIKENTIQLIRLLHNSTHQKVVVLIDEYDKPILDNIDKTEYCLEIRDELRNFYEVFKAMDEYLKFVMLTGVSKFSKVSIFSGLNNLYDITVNKKYSAICGYTESELDKYFSEYLIDVDRKKLRQWYNGFSWSGEAVYNPFDILQFIPEKTYSSYWFQTGTPTFLIKLLIQNNYFVPDIERVVANENILSSFDITDIHPVALLFQTGYLTIKEVNTYGNMLEYVLSYPNLEVKSAFNDFILQYFVGKYEKDEKKVELYKNLMKGNVEGVINQFQSLFAGIPYQWYMNNKLNEYEGFFASVFYSVFQSLGVDCVAEDITNKGRIDLTVKMDEYIYIFEFKVMENFSDNKKAIEQIEEKKYYEKYLNENKTIYLAGIDFSKEERNIKNFEYRKIN